MSNFEDIETEKAFAMMMAANDLDSGNRATLGLTVVPMEYDRVGIDYDEGEELHEVLQVAHDQAEIELRDRDIELDGNWIVGDLITNIMQNAAAKSDAGEAFQQMFAVDGFGWFGVQDPRNRKHLKDGLLLPTERLFGKLGGIAFGSYHSIDKRGMDKLLNNGEQPDSTSRPGGLIGISDVKICRADDELGEIDRSFELVFLPVPIRTFKWARAYKLQAS